MRPCRARLPRDRVGTVLTAVWAVGHVAVAGLLAEASGSTSDTAVPDRAVATSPDTTLSESEGDLW
ncbi:hypothetical protein ADK90_28030 [Streptomyces sp. XY413]|nr:hypothetical protein ADK96_18905 [Streptomyces sp. IGB124]KOV16372.1 hypothetical protein ADK90_28030 [Streptomyces sp. XY413]